MNTVGQSVDDDDLRVSIALQPLYQHHSYDTISAKQAAHDAVQWKRAEAASDTRINQDEQFGQDMSQIAPRSIAGSIL